MIRSTVFGVVAGVMLVIGAIGGGAQSAHADDVKVAVFGCAAGTCTQTTVTSTSPGTAGQVSTITTMNPAGPNNTTVKLSGGLFAGANGTYYGFP